ncbi:Uncharacterised protein [Mycobacterium tuberculosis]|nr:Uncharacterised protein [Mycobacterium tuberculosis]
MSGSCSERLLVVTASARSLPDLMCGIELPRMSNMLVTWPPIKSTIAGAAPLYGMWVISTLTPSLNSSPPRCCGVPLPAEANVTRLAGFLAYST